MKKSTKILVLLLTLAMICAGLVIATSADTSEAETVSYVVAGETAKGTLADAIASADAGTTVKLLGNCTVADAIAVAKTVTVDLNGYALTTSGANAFNVSGAETVFTVTGTGSINAAGVLATATEDGATINVVGTGVDGITVTHTGTGSVEFINLKSNTLLIDNIELVAKKGEQGSTFINNVGNSNISIKNSSLNFDFANMGGWRYLNEKGDYMNSFVKVKGTTTFNMQDSAVYTRNMFIDASEMDNGTSESIVIKNSTVRVNDTDTQKTGARLALVFAASGNTSSGVINVYDSLLDCSGRMFASEVNNTKIVINAYGVTIKSTWSENDMIANSNAGCINRKMQALNLYNSENGTPCKIISVDGALCFDTNCGGLRAMEPGVRVNLASITTSIALKTAIMVPGAVDEAGNVTSWTYAATSTDDVYEWVYDPVGDPDAPYVLIDNTKTTVSTPTYYTNLGFDAIRFNKKDGPKDNTLRAPGGNSGTANDKMNDSEGYANLMQVSNGAGATVYLGSEPGNSYFKYATTSSSLSSAYFITGKNTKTQSVLEKTAFSNKVIVNEFDLAFETGGSLPVFDMLLQCRGVKTNADGSTSEVNLGAPTALSVDKTGKINNQLSGASNDAYTQLNANEWYRVSVVFYPESNLAYMYINGVLMGNTTCYTSASNLASADPGTAYVQGVRFALSGTNVANTSICLDNISTRTYADYQNDETKDTLSGSLAYDYIIPSSPRKYIGKTVTVNGRPVADMEESVANAIKNGSKIDVNSIANLGDVKYNVTVDSNGNNVAFGEDSYGFVKNGTNYTLNENYWYNAYKFTGDINKLAAGTYGDSDFTLVGKIKLGHEFNIDNFYTDRVENYVNLTVDTQNGWIYDMEATASVLPKAPDLSDLAMADENKNVYYLPLLEAVPMSHVVKDAEGNILSYGLTNDDTNNAFLNLVSGTTLVLLQDLTVSQPSSTYIIISNIAPIEKAGDVKTVNGVAIDNDYTDEEIETMRQVASEYKIDLNGNTLDLSTYRIVIGQNVEYSVYSSKPGANINMMYFNGSKLVGPRTFNMMYSDPANPTKWQEGADDMLENMNSRYNFGTYTDRKGNEVKSEMITMTGDVIFEGVSADSSCSFNISDVIASRVSSASWATIVTRCFDGKINVKNSVIAAYGLASSKYAAVHVMQAADGSLHPDIVFEDCLFLSDNPVENFVSDAGPSTDNSRNIIFRNCTSNIRLNSADRAHVYFGEGTASQNMLVGGQYDTEGLIEAYCWEPMTTEGFAADGDYFVKVLKPVYDAATGKISYTAYYFVNNGYGEKFAAEYPGAAYYELPLLTTKVVKEEDAVRVSFSRLDGSEAIYAYYEKGTDVQTRFVGTDRKSVNNWDLKQEYRTYNANAVTLTYAGWEALPTNVQEDVVIKPTYTVAPNVSGLKANLSLYADFNVNLYIPAAYADYLKVYVLENAVDTTAYTSGDAEYLMATVSQKCNMATDNVVFTLKIAETVDGKLCEATVNASVSIAGYAATVLAGESFTDADKVLMYYMLNYANEAEAYIDGTANETVNALLLDNVKYGSMYNADYTYSDVVDTASLGAAFDNATLNIESTPAFLLTLKAGFEGTVTVSYANGLNVRKYTVTADDARALVIEGMKIYNFGTMITITAEGTVNGEAVSVEGKYTLDTFANYHDANSKNEDSETKADSEACMTLVKSLVAYAEVAELYKTGALAGALVTE